jgi:hypothetical protein
MSDLTPALPTREQLLSEALTHWQLKVAAEEALLQSREILLIESFHLGGKLCALKEDIGHGGWLHWLGSHLPGIKPRVVTNCMALFRANDPKSAAATDLTAESIRQFLWYYIPAKERPQLEGNKKIGPAFTPLTFVNNFTAWDRRVQIGLATVPDQETLQRELAPVVKRMGALLGRDFILEQITAA